MTLGTLLIGQKGDEEQRAESDKENYHEPFKAERITQNFFLVYHEVTAHLKWVSSRPADAVAYKRFQVSGGSGSFSFFWEPVF